MTLSNVIRTLNKNSVFRFFSSVRLAVPLMIVIIVSVAAGTVFDRSNMNSETGSIFQEKQSPSLASSGLGKAESHAAARQDLLATSPPTAESAAPGQADALQKNAAQPPAAGAKNQASTFDNVPAAQEGEPKTPVSATDPRPSQSADGFQREVQKKLPTKIIGPPQSHLKQRPLSAADFAVALPLASPSPVPMIRRLRPQNAMVSITGGMLFSQTRGVEYHNNYSLGLMGQLAFGRHLRLLAGAEHSSANFRAHGSGLPDFRVPPPTPPTPNDDLKVVELRQPIWDFLFGLRYVFTPEKRLHPYVSAGWLGQFVQEQTLRYEFLNGLTEAETYVIVPRNNDYFNANGLQLGIGLEWAFTKRLSLGLEGLYRRQASTLVPLLVERWGLKTGLGYRF